MAKSRSVREQAGRNRIFARILGVLAALPSFAIAFISVYFAGEVIATGLNGHALDGLALFYTLLFGWAFLLIGRWSFTAVRAAMTSQPVQVMWLRRFQSESGTAFRASRVIDRLGRYGISSLTLQDRDVQLSLEQRRNRLGGFFWLIFPPIVVAIEAFVVFGYHAAYIKMHDQQMAAIHDAPQAHSAGEFFSYAIRTLLVNMFELLALYLGYVFMGLLAAFFVAAGAVTLVATFGPIGERLSRKRDDFAKLPRLVTQIAKGKRSRGSIILRIADANWQEAVRISLAASDVAIIDLSSITEAILWEVGEALEACGPRGLVFIGRAGANAERALSATLYSHLLNGEGETGKIVVYPENSHQGGRAGQQFARALREAIYAAADRRRDPI